MALLQLSKKNNITGNNSHLDLVNMNAYIKFGEILSIGSQDLECKRSFGIHQGSLLWYKCAKNDICVTILSYTSLICLHI